MKIIGRGMIAQSLHPYHDQAPDVVIFASGVANSLTSDQSAFEREYLLLADTLRFCRAQNSRIVYFSSGGAIYGPIDSLRNELTPTLPASKYGQHKLRCETMIIGAGVPYLILRLANLVGGGQNQSQLIPSLVQQVKNGRVTLFTRATRDLLDVEDFARFLLRLLETNPPNDLYVFASGQSTPVLKIAEEICSSLSLPAKFELVDGGDRQHFDVGKLNRILPEGMNFDADYFRSVLTKYILEYVAK
jgi:NDP-hexose 4-ketoreductase